LPDTVGFLFLFFDDFLLLPLPSVTPGHKLLKGVCGDSMVFLIIQRAFPVRPARSLSPFDFCFFSSCRSFFFGSRYPFPRIDLRFNMALLFCSLCLWIYLLVRGQCLPVFFPVWCAPSSRRGRGLCCCRAPRMPPSLD